MVQQRQLNLPIAVAAFESMQCLLDGAKQADGGTALAMASIALMIKLAHYGALRRHHLVR
jgi:hypothetical protein